MVWQACFPAGTVLATDCSQVLHFPCVAERTLESVKVELGSVQHGACGALEVKSMAGTLGAWAATCLCGHTAASCRGPCAVLRHVKRERAKQSAAIADMAGTQHASAAGLERARSQLRAARDRVGALEHKAAELESEAAALRDGRFG